jgi:hypothetical protein
MPAPRTHLYPVGTVVGRLTVTGEVLRPRPDGRNRRKLLCTCQCGSELEVLPSNLGSGDTRSCGCLQRSRAAQANTTHGGKAKGAGGLYGVWRGMRQRCTNPNSHNYKWYGGKGVTIEWEDFSSFSEWALDSGYTTGVQLDRIDRDGPYSPDNCWWVSPSDNLLRAGLHIDRKIDQLAVSHAQTNNMSFNSLVEQALRHYLMEGR